MDHVLDNNKDKQSALMCLWMEKTKKKMGHNSFSEGLLVVNVWASEVWGKKPSAAGDEEGLEKFGSCAVFWDQGKNVSFPLGKKLFFWWANSEAHSSQRRCPKSGFHGATKNYVEFWKEREEQVLCWRKRPPLNNLFPLLHTSHSKSLSQSLQPMI